MVGTLRIGLRIPSAPLHAIKPVETIASGVVVASSPHLAGCGGVARHPALGGRAHPPRNDARRHCALRTTHPLARYDGPPLSSDSSVLQQRAARRAPIACLLCLLSHHFDLLSCSRPC